MSRPQTTNLESDRFPHYSDIGHIVHNVDNVNAHPLAVLRLFSALDTDSGSPVVETGSLNAYAFSPHNHERRFHHSGLHRRIRLSTAPILIQIGDGTAVLRVQLDSRVSRVSSRETY